MKMKEILKEKGKEVITIDAEAGVLDAAHRMMDRNVGALIVEDEGKLGGIVTERDIVTILAKNECAFEGLKVRDFMVKSESLLVAEPDDLEDYVMAVMIQKGIRHMPIVENGELVGLVSIRDVVQAHVKKLKADVHFLTDFLS